MTKYKLLLILVFFSSVLTAQNGSTSPYSSGGLGERNFNGTQAARHMGGLDVFTDSIHANLNNPASYGFLKLTTFSVGVHYKSNNLASDTASQNTDTASLDYLSVSIPAGIFGFGFGIIPFTSVGYRIEGISETNNLETLNRFEATGGINQTYLSIGFPIAKYFALGATINYNFGTLFYRTGQYVEGIDNGTFLTNQSSLSGLNYQFSAQANIPIKKKYTFQGMFSHQPEAPLNSQNNRLFYTQSLSLESVSDFVEINLKPSGLEKTVLDVSETNRLGVGFGKNKKWFLGVQTNKTKSSDFSNEFYVRENISYKDSKQWIVGGYYIPNYTSLTSFWSRVVYRFGFRTEQMSIVFNDIPLTETGLSMGLGLPLGNLSNANIGLEISQRGQTDSGLLKERMIALRIGLSLNDVWFVKRKYN